jgi:hypothetical protein
MALGDFLFKNGAESMGLLTCLSVKSSLDSRELVGIFVII